MKRTEPAAKRATENKTTTPPPPPRLGPRPLPLHLAMAAGLWLGAIPAAAMMDAIKGAPRPLFPWMPEDPDENHGLESDLKAADPGALAAALAAEGADRYEAFLAGIKAYQVHPYRRPHAFRRGHADPPVLWRQGATRLLDYGVEESRGGVAALVIPSMVNRAYILDLAEDNSFLRHLAGQGVHPYLLDWGSPGAEERDFDIGAYVTGRLEPALAVVRARSGGPVAVIGYCMGGVLAVALAQRRRADVGRLALLATPWDFHAEMAWAGPWMGLLGRALDSLLDADGLVPVDVLQSLFACLQPAVTAEKFRRFADLPQDGARARRFVQIEDWLNDGVPLTAPVAGTCFTNWYADNQPARGAWHVEDAVIEAQTIDCPSLVVAPERDRLVPPGSAMALAEQLPDAAVLRPGTGHIGMVAGTRARTSLWQPLAAWLRD